MCALALFVTLVSHVPLWATTCRCFVYSTFCLLRYTTYEREGSCSVRCSPFESQYQFENKSSGNRVGFHHIDFNIVFREIWPQPAARRLNLTMLWLFRALNNPYYQNYASYVVFFTELTMMAEGNIFVGTFSSNVARMIVIWREAKGLPRGSTLSVDNPVWYPGRRVLLTE